jgi:Tfp pilus assembly protein PilV
LFAKPGNHGFTLIEALVSIVIGVAIVVGIGGLAERLVHHRETADSNSAAMSLAERQMERLLASQNPSTDSNLNGTNPHTATSGSFNISWTVTDANTTGTRFVLSSGSNPSAPNVKSITLTVTHANNPAVRATIERHLIVNTLVFPP